MTPEHLMRQIFLKEYKSIVYESKHHYISFSLIAQGIEFLGRCLDDENGFEWEGKEGERDYSSKIFRKVFETKFPTSYRKFVIKNQPFDLYENLRCGLIHRLIPKSPIGLTHRKEAELFGTKHLQLRKDINGNDAQLNLICEDFYDDFEKVVLNVIAMIESNELKHPKLKDHLLYVPEPIAYK